MVVSGGVRVVLMPESSNPITEMSCGMRYPNRRSASNGSLCMAQILLISRLTAVKIAHGKDVAECVGFFGDTLRKPLEKQSIPYHLAVTLIQK